MRPTRVVIGRKRLFRKSKWQTWGATGWVFWNAAEKPVTTVREGQTVTVPAKGLVYLQLAADGTVEVREPL